MARSNATSPCLPGLPDGIRLDYGDEKWNQFNATDAFSIALAVAVLIHSAWLHKRQWSMVRKCTDGAAAALIGLAAADLLWSSRTCRDDVAIGAEWVREFFVTAFTGTRGRGGVHCLSARP